MDDYKEMGLLYEAFAKYPNGGHAKDTSRAFTPNQPSNPHHSYGKRIPLTDPGGSGRGYDANVLYMSDEETHTEPKEIKPKEIMNLVVLDKISELQQSVKAEGEGQQGMVAIYVLGQLKDYIISLND